MVYQSGVDILPLSYKSPGTVTQVSQMEDGTLELDAETLLKTPLPKVAWDVED